MLEGGSDEVGGGEVDVGGGEVDVGGASGEDDDVGGEEVGGRLVAVSEELGGIVGGVVTGPDVSAVEVGDAPVPDGEVGVAGVPVSVGSAPLLVELEDIVNLRSKVSRRRGGLYMVCG